MDKPQPEWGIKLSKYMPIPQRVILSLMGFLALVNAYTMRICLSVTITRLVVARNYTDDLISTAEVCEADEDETISGMNGHFGIYDWSQTLQGFILSSFYCGYIISHLPGGVLAEKYGGKWVLSLGILLTAIFTFLTPLCIDLFGATGLITLRVVMGIGEGTTFPALSTLLAQWVPRKERGLLGSLVLGGSLIGTVVGNLISGLILAYMDWPWVFYVFGAGAVLWFIFFTFLCFSAPADHPYIKPSEKGYLFKEMGHIERRHDLPPTPWRYILTSAPVLSLICAQIGHDWGFFVIVTDLPKYMNDVMRFSIKNNGIFSSLPFVVMWITSLFAGFVTDILINRNLVDITNARKFNTTFALGVYNLSQKIFFHTNGGHLNMYRRLRFSYMILAAFGPAIFMVLASYAGCDRMLVVLLLTISMGTMGPYYAGMKLTPMDLSSNYSGVIMAATNGFAAITGFIAPVTVGWMTPNTTLGEWRDVFWVSFFILVSTAIVYCFFASGEIQDWDEPDKLEQKKLERKKQSVK